MIPVDYEMPRICARCASPWVEFSREIIANFWEVERILDHRKGMTFEVSLCPKCHKHFKYFDYSSNLIFISIALIAGYISALPLIDNFFYGLITAGLVYLGCVIFLLSPIKFFFTKNAIGTFSKRFSFRNKDFAKAFREMNPHLEVS